MIPMNGNYPNMMYIRKADGQILTPEQMLEEVFAVTGEPASMTRVEAVRSELFTPATEYKGLVCSNVTGRLDQKVLASVVRGRLERLETDRRIRVLDAMSTLLNELDLHRKDSAMIEGSLEAIATSEYAYDRYVHGFLGIMRELSEDTVTNPWEYCDWKYLTKHL